MTLPAPPPRPPRRPPPPPPTSTGSPFPPVPSPPPVAPQLPRLPTISPAPRLSPPALLPLAVPPVTAPSMARRMLVFRRSPAGSSDRPQRLDSPPVVTNLPSVSTREFLQDLFLAVVHTPTPRSRTVRLYPPSSTLHLHLHHHHQKQQRRPPPTRQEDSMLTGAGARDPCCSGGPRLPSPVPIPIAIVTSLLPITTTTTRQQGRRPYLPPLWLDLISSDPTRRPILRRGP